MSGDPGFPQMAEVLDLAVMGPLLDKALRLGPPAGQHGGAWQVDEKRYKPGKSLIISYRRENDSGSAQPPRFAMGRLYPPGEARREFERERSRRPELDEGAMCFLAEPAMLLWVFPHDRKLIHLPRLLDDSRLPAMLAPKLEALGLDSPRRVSIVSQVLHYLPECSCMIRYRVQAQDSATRAGETALLYAKNYADEQGAEVYSIMVQLRGQFPWGAQALAYDGDTRTLWQSHVPGAPLSWADFRGSEGSAMARRMGGCVASFHQCSVTTERRVLARDVELALLKTRDIARQARPEFGERIGRSVQNLLARFGGWPEVPLSPIHHDLKLNNFLVTPSSLGLIDMDCVCLGDPLADLASLIANLYLNGLREGCPAEDIHSLVRELVRAYGESRGRRMALQRLRWHVAAALIHEVLRRSLRQLDSRRMAHLQAYLDLSDHYSEACRARGDEVCELI
jgi:hypothetical protein